MLDERLRNIIALSLVKGVGAVSMKKSLLFIQAYAGDWKKLAKMGAKVDETKLAANFPRAAEILQACVQHNIQAVSLADEAYPKSLLALKDPPPILYYKGNLALAARAIGLVGTSKSSNLGNKIAQRISAHFSQRWAMCSGLTSGINEYAILGENGAIRPRSIGVLSAGLNYTQTSSAIVQQLATQVLKADGLLLSEFAPNQPEDQFAESRFSRVQAGICRGLILVQSPLDGEAKYSLRPFVSLNRPVGVVAFPSNQEYAEHALFAANRLVLAEQEAGLVKFCVAKKIGKVLLKALMPISQQEDYAKFEVLLH